MSIAQINTDKPIYIFVRRRGVPVTPTIQLSPEHSQALLKRLENMGGYRVDGDRVDGSMGIGEFVNLIEESDELRGAVVADDWLICVVEEWAANVYSEDEEFAVVSFSTQREDPIETYNLGYDDDGLSALQAREVLRARRIDRVVKNFEHLVTDHAATLDADYLRKLVRKQGSAIACTMPLLDALRHDVELGDWISENIVESQLQANEWLDFCGAGAETIGEIDGSPVWFNRRAGIYCYALAAGLGTVEVWLTAPHYPPGW